MVALAGWVLRQALTYNHSSLTKQTPLERDFLATAQALAATPGVNRFEYLRQVSTKNSFDFGLSMEFATRSDYDDAYNVHPHHIAFAENRWKPEVADFLEIDYTLLQMWESFEVATVFVAA